MSKQAFNNFSDMPQIVYKIISHLMENNENIFKLLKYNTKDALSKPNIPLSEKRKMLYLDDGIADNKYGIFMKPLIDDEVTSECAQLRIYKCAIQPTNAIDNILNYEFDILCGAKMTLVYDEDDIPCTRIDLLEKEILKEMNGLDLFGAGYFQFSRELSRNCSERMGLSNSKTFYGSCLILACHYISVDEGMTCDINE